ncbi:MAG TPA: competence type IV pilus ATPase ComGA [Bacillota bacterium]|nr:competence type IV pilus ATPase ComGA [Bacillota bacterium]
MNSATSLSKSIIEHAICVHASDIHFIPCKKGADVYFRINNKRSFHQAINIDHYNALLTHYKFTSGMDIGEIQKPQNGSLTFTLNQYVYSLRLSTLPVQHTESLAIRILPQEASRQLNQLFLFHKQYKRIKEWTCLQSGLLLLTGPTGSGKSTTLYALIHEIIQTKEKQLITLEDPIEQQLPDILQVQLNEKAGITYAEGFKAILRHDPDIVMIGEIRDATTAAFAVNAALSGHVVFSTFHASNAVGAITRLLEMGIDPADLRASLKAVAAIELINIHEQNETEKRSAILEILEEHHIDAIIHRQPIPFYETFQNLRKEAYQHEQKSSDY